MVLCNPHSYSVGRSFAVLQMGYYLEKKRSSFIELCGLSTDRISLVFLKSKRGKKSGPNQKI